jgi:hypothetical protein
LTRFGHIKSTGARESPAKLNKKNRNRKSTRYQLQNRLVEIRKLQDDGRTNRQKSSILKIRLRTIEYYVKRIHDQDKECWQQVERESLEGRTITIKRHYEELAQTAEAIFHESASLLK